MKWALVNSSNQIVNVIIYDGTSDYTPAAGKTLLQVPDDHGIGDTYIP